MEKVLKMPETEKLTSLSSSEGEHRLHSRDEMQGSEMLARRNLHEDDDNYGKRSAVSRMKAMARRWKSSFGKKKHGLSEVTSSPAQRISLVEEEDENPEFHGAPMYESATASQCQDASENLVGTPSPKMPPSSTLGSPPTSDEPAAIEQPRIENPSAINKNGYKEFIGGRTAAPAVPEEDTSDCRTLSQNVSEMLMPAYNMVARATQAIASKIHSQPEFPSASATAGEELGAKPSCDKDMSVMNYLIEKLQPAEDEKVLSQVITESISTMIGGDGEGGEAGQGVVSSVEKFKGAVSALLGMEEIPESPLAREMVPTTAMDSPATEKISAEHSQAGVPVSTSPF